jgi:microcystin degradation protein MlrC
MRLFAGGIATETNAFSPTPTGLADFEVVPADADPAARDRVLFGSSFRRYARHAAELGGSFVQGLYALALPSGPIPRTVYESLRDELLAQLTASLPVDGVVLTLHGSMVADGYEDCETDLVQRVRVIVGDRAKIGVLLDLHCDLPDALIDAADVIVTFKEYPHVDINERADELIDLVTKAILGQVSPVMATFDCRMMGVYPTTRAPMRDFVDRELHAAERRPFVLSASLGHGFPWADTPASGARTLVVADRDTRLAKEVAEALARSFYDRRHAVTILPPGMDEALEQALAKRSAPGPVVIAEMSDNPGGGAPSDATFVLRELLRRNVRNAGIALVWDPIAVDLACAAGVGARLTLRLGGKMGPMSGDPLDLTVTVRGVEHDLVQLWPQTSGGAAEIPCGDVACLECNGIDIIVGSVRHQPMGVELFTAFGIDPADHDLLVLKSMNHFQAAYAPIAANVIHMSGPGALNQDPRMIGLRNTSTHKFPWIEDPWNEQPARVE